MEYLISLEKTLLGGNSNTIRIMNEYCYLKHFNAYLCVINSYVKHFLQTTILVGSPSLMSM